ncbi:MAG: acetylornithine/succinylornithine family transaminase [Defluviitaleaceae bacterium]|nr:acetylornithine/succinylornithine family transaminase [Defluviitaleaceae bacterium]
MNNIISNYQHVLPTYGRYPVAFVKGAGSRLWDSDGKEYVDFASGIGTNSVGHSHPRWVKAVAGQLELLAHTSNLFYTQPGGLLAQKLCQLSGLEGVFFGNSGAEANEGMIKAARKYSRDKYGQGRATIITLENSFHGRTITTLAATGQDKFHQHFHPFTEGFKHVAAGDISQLEAQGEDVCAVMIETIQGEGGVNVLPPEYIQAVARLCQTRDWLLLIDEVQTGMGRTGYWFSYQGLGVLPDAISFAKGIAGGLPLGGFLLGKKLHGVLNPGDHGSTYGGNLICCTAALAVIDILEGELPNVEAKGEYIRSQIAAMNLPQVVAIRARGLMLGIQLKDIAPAEINQQLLNSGLVALTAGADVLRFLPPLNISTEDIDSGLAIFKAVMSKL